MRSILWQTKIWKVLSSRNSELGSQESSLVVSPCSLGTRRLAPHSGHTEPLPEHSEPLAPHRAMALTHSARE